MNIEFSSEVQESNCRQKLMVSLCFLSPPPLSLSLSLFLSLSLSLSLSLLSVDVCGLFGEVQGEESQRGGSTSRSCRRHDADGEALRFCFVDITCILLAVSSNVTLLFFTNQSSLFCLLCTQTPLQPLMEDVLAGLDNKNPSVRTETLLFLVRFFCRGTPAVAPKPLLKQLCPVLVKVRPLVNV